MGKETAASNDGDQQEEGGVGKRVGSWFGHHAKRVNDAKPMVKDRVEVFQESVANFLKGYQEGKGDSSSYSDHHHHHQFQRHAAEGDENNARSSSTTKKSDV